MSIKAVIFDLDGTITQPYFDFDAIREEMGLDRNSGPVLESMQKMTPQERQRVEKILHFHESRAVMESELNKGAKKTLAVDLNPLCVRTANENIRLNDLSGIIQVVEGSAEDFADEAGDLVIANIHKEIIGRLLHKEGFRKK